MTIIQEDKLTSHINLFIQVEACLQVEKELLAILQRLHSESECSKADLHSCKMQLVNQLCMNIFDKKKSLFDEIKASKNSTE